MKIPCTIILLLCTLSALCQNNPENKGKWNIGFTISPDTYFNSSNISLTNETGIGSVAMSRFNFTSGIFGEWSFNSKIEIGSGINYSRKDFSGTFYCSVCDLWMVPKPESIKLRFIEVPLFIRYNILDKKFGVHVDAGITGGYMTNEIKPVYWGFLSANKFQLGGKLGLGISLDVSQRINLSLTSDFRQSFTNTFEDTNLKFRSVGLITGIKYKIN